MRKNEGGGLNREQRKTQVREGCLIAAYSGLVSERKTFSSILLHSIQGCLQIKLIKSRLTGEKCIHLHSGAYKRKLNKQLKLDA